LSGVHQPAGLHHALRVGAERRQRERARGPRLPPGAHAVRRDQGLGPRVQGRRAGSHEELHQRQDLLAAVATVIAATPAATATPSTRALRFAQCRILLLLFLGYASCYFCRSNLSVATPLLLDELARRGISHAEAMVSIGSMASWGVLAYALGKWFLTGLGDYWGGKRNLLIATGGAAAFTLLFASSSTLPIFTLAWVGNRLAQSIGWSALIKVCSRWFHYSRYGTVAAILTCSYLVGDAAARQSMALVLPLLRSRAFLMVCLLSFAATMVRETFNTWTPMYLRDFLGYGVSHAAGLSAIFPGVGAVSVLLGGWASDRLGPNARSLLLVLGLAATAVALLVLTSLRPGSAGVVLPVAVIGLVAFCLLGPYSFLPGAFALDFGGKQAGAAASGLVDGTGYMGGILAGTVMARLAVAFGWGGVFITLACVSALAALGAGYLYVLNARAAAPAPV